MKAEVKKVMFVSKEDALKIMRKKYPELTNDLAYNPLPNSFEVTPTKARGHGADRAGDQGDRSSPGVDKIKYGQKTAHRILSVAQGDRVDLPRRGGGAARSRRRC